MWLKPAAPALLFEDVAGYDMPVLINIFGSARRMGWALGVDELDQLGDRFRELLGLVQGPPEGILNKLRTLGQIIQLGSFSPRTVRRAPCQEVVLEGEDVNLDQFPILKCWPLDGGRYITLPLVISKDPETGVQNYGTYRLQVYDSRTTGMHWQTHKVGTHHYRMGQETGNGQAGHRGCSGWRPDEHLDRLRSPAPGHGRNDRGRFLEKGSGGVGQGQDQRPARSRPRRDRVGRLRGPWRGTNRGSFRGPYWLLLDGGRIPRFPCNVYHPAAANPSIPLSLWAALPWRTIGWERSPNGSSCPRSGTILPEVVDINMPAEGIFHNLVIVSIKKEYPGQARKVMPRPMGAGAH